MSQAISYFFRLQSGVDYRFHICLERPDASGDLSECTLLEKTNVRTVRWPLPP